MIIMESPWLFTALYLKCFTFCCRLLHLEIFGAILRSKLSFFAMNPWQCISSALHLLRDKSFLLWAVGKPQRQTKTQPCSAALNQRACHFLSQNCPAQMQAASDTFSMESYMGLICALDQVSSTAFLTRAWRGIAVLCVEYNIWYLFVENTAWWWNACLGSGIEWSGLFTACSDLNPFLLSREAGNHDEGRKKQCVLPSQPWRLGGCSAEGPPRLWLMAQHSLRRGEAEGWEGEQGCPAVLVWGGVSTALPPLGRFSSTPGEAQNLPSSILSPCSG